jgi:hypothetical protein
MVKRRGTTRKTRSNRRRTMRRLRGGAKADSCPAGSIIILEDKLRIADPTQKICYGDEITTCSTVTIVMRNKYKIGAHFNGTFFQYPETSGGRVQNINPTTILTKIKEKLDTNENFRGSTIEKIYLMTSFSNLYIHRDQHGAFKSNLNNNISQARLPVGRRVVLTDANKMDFFNSAFPGKVTNDTVIEIHKDKQVQFLAASKKGRVSHMIVNEDGSLDLKAYS